MAIAHMSPLYPKTVKGSKAGGEKLIDKYDVAAQYIHHVLKIINGTCSQKTRYVNLLKDILCDSKIKSVFFNFLLYVLSNSYFIVIAWSLMEGLILLEVNTQQLI